MDELQPSRVPILNPRRWIAPLAYVFLTVYFTWPVLASGDALGIGDWDALLFQHAAVFRSVYEFGQPPFWNPWYCGGNVLWQNPQAPFLSPAYLLAPFVGLIFAVKLTIVLHYAIGFAGMHVLTRALGVRTLAWTVLIGSLFVLAGGATMHIAEGHATFLPYFYLPWLLLATIRLFQTGRWRYSVVAAAWVAFALWNGGLHLTFMSAVALACFTVAVALCLRSWRPLAMLAATGALAAAFAAPRLVPILVFVGDPRLVDIRYFPPMPDAMNLNMLLHAFFDPFQYRRMVVGGMNYGWHEYGNYVGAFGALLMAASFFWIVSSRPWKRVNWLGTSLALTAAVLFVLALGEFAPFAPYTLLRKLPFLAQFRLPSRYLLLFTLFAAATVAWVIRAAAAEQEPAGGFRRMMAITAILATAFLAYRGSLFLVGSFSLAPAPSTSRFLSRPPPPKIDVTTDGFAPDSPMLRAFVDGRAVLKCNEPLQLPGTVDPSQAVIYSDGSARLSDIEFSPNRIEFRAMAGAGAARVFLNQRYTTGWRSNIGALTLDPQTGLAFIALPPGAVGRFAFSFVPRGIVPGSVLFVIGVAASVVLWRRRLAGVPEDSVPRRGELQS